MSKKKKFDSIINWIFGIGTVGMAAKAGAKIKQYQVEHNPTEEAENTVGYNDISVRYNTEVHTNNFVVLHVKNTPGYDISDIRAKLEKCNELGIEVSLVLDTDAEDLATIYTDVDFLQAIVKEYKIDLPIYLNIDNVMMCSSTNNAQKKEIINAFLDKASRSDMYIGVYGCDSNLADCKEYVTDLSPYDCFLVEEASSSRYDGVATITQDVNGNITASENLAKVINERHLNSANRLVYSSKYTAKEGDTYHSIALQFGLSEDDLRSYNEMYASSELHAGDSIYIPNMYISENQTTQQKTLNHAVARGIDISDYQTNIDWARVKETSDYVIVEVARNAGNYTENMGSFIPECVDQIKNTVSNGIDLGLYICVSKDMNVDAFRERLQGWLDTLDRNLSENRIDVNKAEVPIFLDFEVYYQYNDYYRLMKTFDAVCREHGYTKIGIYGNSSTLKDISVSMHTGEESISLKETDWYVWMSGGPQYSAREHTSYDDVTLAELEEVPSTSNNEFITSMRQVTNVCTDTGAANHMQHCDVSYLYDGELFGGEYGSDDVICETRQVDLSQYSHIPVSKAVNVIGHALDLTYAIMGFYLVGNMLVVKVKQKIKEKKQGRVLK